jgi:hypothetical protein
MGWRDLFSSESRTKRAAALAVGLESGLLQQCLVCREVTERHGGDTLLQASERLAERWIAERDPRVDVFGGDAEALKRAIRELRRSAPFDCVCQRI